MITGERWMIPRLLALFGFLYLLTGGLMLAFWSRSIANQAQEVARLPVATADTLNEGGTRVLIEGRVDDRMGFSDRPPLVAYNENERSYVPTLWVQIPGKEVEVTEGYQIRSTPPRADGGINRSYGGFEVNDPVLVLGTLSTAGDRPMVSEAEIGFETKEAYLVSLERESQQRLWFSLFWLVLGGLMTLWAGRAYLVLRGSTNLSGVP